MISTGKMQPARLAPTLVLLLTLLAGCGGEEGGAGEEGSGGPRPPEPVSCESFDRIEGAVTGSASFFCLGCDPQWDLDLPGGTDTAFFLVHVTCEEVPAPTTLSLVDPNGIVAWRETVEEGMDALYCVTLEEPVGGRHVLQLGRVARYRGGVVAQVRDQEGERIVP